MEKFIEAFDMYTSGFDMNNEMIRLKYNHSYRVMELSKHLAENLHLSKDDIFLATIIGLLHDFGRFEQIKNYGTYDDSKSVDHADYSVEYLFDKNYITEYVEDKSLYSIIRKSIQYHNKYAIPSQGLTKRERLHMQIIRDADKLDILYLIGVLKECPVHVTDSPISEVVRSNFFENKPILNSDVTNDNERVIAWLAYIYDLNFKESFVHLLSIHCLEIFFENLGSPEILEPYFTYIIDYVRKRAYA